MQDRDLLQQLADNIDRRNDSSGSMNHLLAEMGNVAFGIGHFDLGRAFRSKQRTVAEVLKIPALPRIVF